MVGEKVGKVKRDTIRIVSTSLVSAANHVTTSLKAIYVCTKVITALDRIENDVKPRSSVNPLPAWPRSHRFQLTLGIV